MADDARRDDGNRVCEPLAGFTIGVTAVRPRNRLATLLEHVGARVVLVPALRLVPLADDTELRAATRCCLRTPPDATVVEIPLYRWAPPVDPAPLDRLIDLIENRLVDAVAFTSAPAVGALLRAAGPRTGPVLEALRTDVLAACAGPVTAAPLRRYDVPVVAPARARLGALVRLLVDELPPRAVHLSVRGHRLSLRGHAALVDGELRPLAPAPMAVLRTLARAPGRVLSRATLLRTLPRGADEHAVEMAVARLRAGLRTPGVVQTVVRRGYRLAVD
jgi:uroporphyrinogen-III synthase